MVNTIKLDDRKRSKKKKKKRTSKMKKRRKSRREDVSASSSFGSDDSDDSLSLDIQEAIDGTHMDLDKEADRQLKELDEMQNQLDELRKPGSPYIPLTDENDLFPPSNQEASYAINGQKVKA